MVIVDRDFGGDAQTAGFADDDVPSDFPMRT